MEAPRLPSMYGFKAKKPNQFYYEPRYYDAQKEKMDQRYKKIGKELGVKNTERTNAEDFKTELRASWGSGYARNAAGHQVNRKVIFYVLALCALAYFILFK